MCIPCILIPLITGLVSALLGYLLGKKCCNNDSSNSLKADFDSLKLERDKLFSVNNDLNAKISSLSGNVSNDASLRATIGGLENEIINLKAQLADCNAKVTVVPTDTDDWKGRFESLNNEFTAHKASAENRINSLENELSSFVVAKVPVVPDDLKIVEGIGPKIEELLNNKGIYTFKQLSAASIDHIREILDEAGPNYKIHDPGTWGKQAQLADEGKWDELKAWQDELDGGK